MANDAWNELAEFLKGKWFAADRGLDCIIEDVTPSTISFRVPDCSCEEHEWVDGTHSISLSDFDEPEISWNDSVVYLTIARVWRNDDIREKYPWFINHKGNAEWVGHLLSNGDQHFAEKKEAYQ